MIQIENEIRNRRDGYKSNERSDTDLIDDNFATKFLNKVQWQLNSEKRQNEFLEVFDKNVNNMFNKLRQSIVVKLEEQNKSYNVNKPRNIEKIFEIRNSVLTDLLEISHIRTVYHIFIAILILFSINTLLIDLIEKGGFVHLYHLKWIFWTFGKFDSVIYIWLCMKLFTILIYPCFYGWFYLKKTFLSPDKVDNIFLIIHIISQISFMVIPVCYIMLKNLPPCSSLIVIMENIRMTMKIHSFIREKTFEEGSNRNFIMPNFSKYIYFLFAPTLIYRDNYPRTVKIRWTYVMSNFIQVLFCIVFLYYTFSSFFIHYFQNFGSNHFTFKQLVLTISSCMLPGSLILFTSFFLLLHSWFNAFAEILRFGDRLFYNEWWNSSSFSNFYRTWNIVVHDWLYFYVYCDVSVWWKLKNRTIRIAIVFLFSAIIHEYVLVVMLRFFYPALFILFIGVGFSMMFINGKSRIWNVLFWVAMFSGMGILLSLYCMEWYARQNCPLYFNRIIDAFVARSWFCHV